MMPGTYTAVAVQDAWGADWMKPDLLAGYLQHGETVMVADGMRGSARCGNTWKCRAGDGGELRK